MPASSNASLTLRVSAVSGPGANTPNMTIPGYVPALCERFHFAKENIRISCWAKNVASGSDAMKVISIELGAADNFSIILAAASAGITRHANWAWKRRRSICSLFRATFNRACSARAFSAFAIAVSVFVWRIAMRSLDLAISTCAWATSAFARSLNAWASAIFWLASFWVASVISYPIHAETNALRIPTPPNISADTVAHLNIVSQTTSVNGWENINLFAFCFFAGCVVFSVVGGVMLVLSRPRRFRPH